MLVTLIVLAPVIVHVLVAMAVVAALIVHVVIVIAAVSVTIEPVVMIERPHRLRTNLARISLVLPRRLLDLLHLHLWKDHLCSRFWKCISFLWQGNLVCFGEATIYGVHLQIVNPGILSSCFPLYRLDLLMFMRLLCTA